MTTENGPVLVFEDQQAWAAWLDRNAGTSNGLWLRIARKGSGLPSVTYAEAVETALCYGWIDGQKKSDTERTWLQKFVPRAGRSMWSKRNREKAVALAASGRMKPAGLAAIERAKASGQWDAAYDAQSRAQVPPDLEAALDANPRARTFFETIDSANRYGILFRIQTAKKPETRARKIQEFVGMLAARKTIHPARKTQRARR